jgi:hypothetical protein
MEIAAQRTSMVPVSETLFKSLLRLSIMEVSNLSQNSMFTILGTGKRLGSVERDANVTFYFTLQVGERCVNADEKTMRRRQ